MDEARGRGAGRDGGRRVDDHAGVAIGTADAEGRVYDFAGVAIGRVIEDGIVEDFGHVHLGALASRGPGQAAP